MGLADHPVYGGNVFSVPGHMCQPSTRVLQPQVRLWTKDRDLDEEPLPPYSGQGLSIRGDEPFWPLQVNFFPFVKPVRLPRKGMSLQQLFASLGPAVVLGLREGQRFRCRDTAVED